MPKVIYLTGAPAAGKSSTSQILAQRADIELWEYRARLTEHCKQRSHGIRSQKDLRAKSSILVTPEDVLEVDRLLIEFVTEKRKTQHVIVDSHPVTKEAYGYRVTAFSQEQITRLNPDEIWVLYADPELTRSRIHEDAGGRPMPSEEEARTHTQTQISVATTYGIIVGCPVYIFDTSQPRELLTDSLLARLAK